MSWKLRAQRVTFGWLQSIFSTFDYVNLQTDFFRFANTTDKALFANGRSNDSQTTRTNLVQPTKKQSK